MGGEDLDDPGDGVNCLEQTLDPLIQVVCAGLASVGVNLAGPIERPASSSAPVWRSSRNGRTPPRHNRHGIWRTASHHLDHGKLAVFGQLFAGARNRRGILIRRRQAPAAKPVHAPLTAVGCTRRRWVRWDDGDRTRMLIVAHLRWSGSGTGHRYAPQRCGVFVIDLLRRTASPGHVLYLPYVQGKIVSRVSAS